MLYGKIGFEERVTAMIYDVAIVGGGAAGLCAAVRLKKLNPTLSVAVIERLQRVGKKLLITGNGRCNITNKNLSLDRYHGENKAFAEYALNKYSNIEIERFFAELGVVFTYEKDGKAYPYSLQASSVLDALRFAAERLDVQFLTTCNAYDFDLKDNIYTLKTDIGNVKSSFLIVATGLFSGGEKLGCDGNLLRVFKSKGYPVVKTTPAIVQLKTEGDVARSLKGMKVNANATLFTDKTKVRTEFGEVLFCEYGLSGPPILQISREASRKSGKITISLDIMPDYSMEKLKDLLAFRRNALAEATLEEFFTGMLNKRVGQAILKLCGYRLSDSVSTLNGEAIIKIAEKIKNMEFTVTGSTGFINSQVTAGGLSTVSFLSKTMMSNRHKNLFCIGEILDIDGDCGGYNLQWAWSSAFCAAEYISSVTGGLV